MADAIHMTPGTACEVHDLTRPEKLERFHRFLQESRRAPAHAVNLEACTECLEAMRDEAFERMTRKGLRRR